MSEFLMVSKNLEIKDLSMGIEMNDKMSSNKENIENDYNIANDEINIEEDTRDPFNEDSEDVEPQASIKPVIQNNSANRRVGRTELVSENGKLKCQDCERTFNSQPALSYHIKSTHEGIKYACNQCDHQATQQGHLKYHIQSKHEGVKYACNQCDYQATQQSNLTTHIQSKHEGVKYACNQCDYQATTQKGLTRHI